MAVTVDTPVSVLVDNDGVPLSKELIERIGKLFHYQGFTIVQLTTRFNIPESTLYKIVLPPTDKTFNPPARRGRPPLDPSEKKSKYKANKPHLTLSKRIEIYTKYNASDDPLIRPTHIELASEYNVARRTIAAIVSNHSYSAIQLQDLSDATLTSPRPLPALQNFQLPTISEEELNLLLTYLVTTFGANATNLHPRNNLRTNTALVEKQNNLPPNTLYNQIRVAQAYYNSIIPPDITRAAIIEAEQQPKHRYRRTLEKLSFEDIETIWKTHWLNAALKADPRQAHRYNKHYRHDLASKFGVTYQTITSVLRQKTYKNITRAIFLGRQATIRE